VGYLYHSFPHLSKLLLEQNSSYDIHVNPNKHHQLRILFRIIEFSAGAGTKLTQEFRSHEVYQYVLDAMLMFLALVALNILHPGKVLVGPESEFPKKQKKSRKEKKREKEEAALEMSSGSGVAV
jgi:hypothetical protein